MYKVVIFDVDGTLFDTSEGICNCINYVLESNEEPILDAEIVKKFIGPPVYESFIKYCGKSSEEALRYTEQYRKYYVKEFINQSKPYERMVEVLNEIKRKNIKLAIATLKTQKQVDVLLENFRVNELFDIVVGVRKYGETKRDILETIINELNVIQGEQEALLVGDTYGDAESAQAVGVDFIGVTHGFGIKNLADLNKVACVTLCDNLSSILKFLE